MKQGILFLRRIGYPAQKKMIFIILLIIIVVFLANQVRIVPQQTCFIIERLGKYSTTWEAGLHIKTPIIDKMVKKISLKEKVYDFPPQDVITKDNVSIKIDSVVYATIFDPYSYTYGIENPIVGLQNLTATTLRSIIGEMELDATLSSRASINSRMQAAIDEATDEWGIKVTRVEVKNIKPPAEIEEVMTKQMRAERERRQTVLEAQAHKESVVSRAEGDKQAKLLAAEAERDAQIALAEGQAQAIALVYEAEASGLKRISEAGINENVLRLKSIEAMKDVADGRATKIFIPNTLTDGIGAAGICGEAFRKYDDNELISRSENNKLIRTGCVAKQVRSDKCLNAGRTKETYSSAMQNAGNIHDMHS